MSASLLYPDKCPFCLSLLPEGRDICDDCVRTLPWTGREGRSHGDFFSLCLSPLRYTGKARQGLRRYKFSGNAAAYRAFGRLMADAVRADDAGHYDVVTYVPLSFWRFRQRGYSQSRLLARALAGHLGLPFRRLLRKRRHSRAQSGIKGAAARKANVSGTFAALEDISGKTVLLVDDVLTSGATMSECSRILLLAGAERVVGVTLCKAVKAQ